MKQLPKIGKEARFYGYIVSLGVATNDDVPLEELNRHLYVMFEYNGERTIWLVPDSRLFALLAKHLCGMAWERANEDGYGYEKLWIEYKNGKWDIQTP
jgi:hypothetical protein